MGKLVSGFANIFTGASDTAAAGQLAGAQQAQATKDAAAAAAFRPVGMTTRFGTSNFTRAIDPKTGIPYVSEAGYTAAPELAGLQNKLFSQFGQGMQLGDYTADQFMPLAGAAQSLFNMGSQQLAESPEAARQRYIQGQQALLAPQQEQTISNIRNQLFQSGRSGLATGGTVAGGMQATNPELAAYYNALAQQQAQISAGADAAVQAQQQSAANLYGQGAGLLGTMATGQASSYAPLQNLLGLSGQVENLSQMPYQLGVQLGQAQQPGQTAGSGMYQQGMNQAYQTQYGATQAANAANAGFWGGLISGAAQGAGAYYGAQAR